MFVFDDKLNAKDLDFFYTILCFLREKKDEIVKIYFKDIQELLFLAKKDKNIRKTKFFDDICSFLCKFSTLKRVEKYGNVGSRMFSVELFFQKIKIDEENNYFEIQVNKDYLHILNDIAKGEFTLFDLQEFVSLKSKYSKFLFRLLKQYKNLGYLCISVEDFKKAMGGIHYNLFENLERAVLVPAIKEINKSSVSISELTYTKKRSKTSNKRGASCISHFTFRFQNIEKKKIKAKIMSNEQDEIKQVG